MKQTNENTNAVVTKSRRPINRQDAAAYDAGFIAKGSIWQSCRWYYLDANGMDAHNSKGERLVVEVTESVNPGGHSLPSVWYKKGYTPTELQTWWSVSTYVYDVNGNCRGAYNPQVKPGTHLLCFDWIKEATPENLRDLLNEVARLFYAA